MNTRISADQLKKQIPIEEVIGNDHPLKPKTKTLLVGDAEDCESLQVHVDGQWFIWWSRGWKGDVFNYLMEAYDIDFRQAFRLLSEFRQACPDLPPPKVFKTYAEKPKPPIDISLPLKLHENLTNSTAALDYLINRGIGFDDITKYRLGFQSNYMGAGDIITIPVYDGEALKTIRFRRMSDNPQIKLPRYGYLFNGYGAQLFNPDVLNSKPDTVYIVEGEFKCITANTFGLPSVGIMGASSMKTEWLDRFKPVRRVIVALDNDQTPFELGWVNRLATIHKNVRVIQLSNKIDDLLLAGCADMILESTESARKVIPPDESPAKPKYN